MADNLFQFAQQCFNQTIREIAAYGIKVNPQMDLRRGKGMLCCYNLDDGHIYFSPPDFSAATGKLHLLFLRSLLACESDDEVFDIFYLLLPYVINHEIGHHLRQYYGLFGKDLWLEEQIADQFACAMTKRRLSPEKKKKAQFYLERAVKDLSKRLGIQGSGAETYYDMWQALDMEGHLEDTSRQHIQLAQKLFAIDPLKILQTHHKIDISQWLTKRTQGIEEINEQYALDAVRYIYHQMQWMYMSLISPELHYIDAFACEHLQLQIPLLPSISTEPTQNDMGILACFKAYKDTLGVSTTANQYFYKRYRSLLIARLESAIHRASDKRISQGYKFLLQTYQGEEQNLDILKYVYHLVPPYLQRLLPNHISKNPLLKDTLEEQLPTETDRRIWQHLVLKQEDEAAANTLSRLAILEHTEIFRYLPAEVGLEITNTISRVLLSPGETIIWQGDEYQDVYILFNGQLEVLISQDGNERQVGIIKEGEAFGEMSFFLNKPRNANVRASLASECFILKATDLYLFAYKYPSVIMEMAKTLAHRLAEMNTKVGSDVSSDTVDL